jgi:threonine dehydratase
VIAQLGANITGVHHDRSANRQKVNSCILRVSMETKNEEQIDQIIKALGSKELNVRRIL